MKAAPSPIKLNAFGLSNLDRRCIKVALEVLEQREVSIAAERCRRRHSCVAIFDALSLLRALMEEPKVEAGAQS